MYTHPAPTLRTRHRWTRPAGAICLISGTAALATLAPGVASAAVLGSISVSPTSGTDSTLFSGSIANAQCPAGTANSFFQIIGADVGANGSGYLGDGTTTGQGRQGFVGASIANLKSTNTGSFSASGAYRITFNCESAAGITDTYRTTLNYVAGGAGAFSIQAPPPPPPPPPASPVASPPPPPPASPVASPVASPPAPPPASPVASPPASPAASPVASPPASPVASPVASPPASPAASPPASPVASASPTGVSFGGGGAGAGGGGGGLPTTGVETGLVLALGTGLLAAGASLLRVGRRRVAGADADATVGTVETA